MRLRIYLEPYLNTLNTEPQQ